MYIDELAKANPNIEALEEYIDAKTPILHKCKIDGYEWMVRPLNTLRGRQCPVCAGQTIWAGYNDLATKYPYLAEEWDYELNKNISPYGLSPSSPEDVWWKCGECGHSYKCRVANRVYNHSGCSRCNKRSSLAEIRVYCYIKKYFPDAINGFHDKKNGLTELDIYIPSLNIGIEYDGERWHRDISKDKNKDNICKNLGIKLFRIRELKCPKYDSSCTFINLTNRCKSTLEDAIRQLLGICGIENPEVNFKLDHIGIHNLIFHKRVNNSLAMMMPDLLQEWHPTKNGKMDPYKVAYKSDEYAWWQCLKCGHEWFATIGSRSAGSGCPQCAKRGRRRKDKNNY